MQRATLPEPATLSTHWTLDPGTVYLNHGSFGACPDRVMAARADYLRRIESEAVRFFTQDLFTEMNRVREALALFCGGAAQDYVMLQNATHAVATVLSNIDLSPGDRVLVTEHEYPACVNNIRRHAERFGAAVDVAPVAFPIESAGGVVESILDHVTPRTRLALISHVTSTSALALPITEIVRELAARDIDTLVDGAHAPGMLDVDLDSIGAAYYTANCHKWLCAPKGSALLHVRRDKQRGFRPLALSNFAKSPSFAHPATPRSFFNLEFDYTGTDDRTAIMCIPDAINCVGSLLPGGWPEVRRRNREMVLAARQRACNSLGVALPAPDDMIGSIASVPLPSHGPDADARLAERPSRFIDALQDRLVDEWRIQIPVWNLAGPDGSRTRFVRLSAQLYNSNAQFDYLSEALRTELERERALL